MTTEKKATAEKWQSIDDPISKWIELRSMTKVIIPSRYEKRCNEMAHDSSYVIQLCSNERLMTDDWADDEK